MTFSSDGKWIIFDGFDAFSIWDAISGQEIKKFDECYHPKFSKDGKSIWYRKAKIDAPSDDRRIIRSESIIQIKLEDDCPPVPAVGTLEYVVPIDEREVINLSPPSPTKAVAY